MPEAKSQGPKTPAPPPRQPRDREEDTEQEEINPPHRQNPPTGANRPREQSQDRPDTEGPGQSGRQEDQEWAHKQERIRR